MTNEEKYFETLKRIHHTTENAFNHQDEDIVALKASLRKVHDLVELATGYSSIVTHDEHGKPFFNSPDWHFNGVR